MNAWHNGRALAVLTAQKQQRLQGELIRHQSALTEFQSEKAQHQYQLQLIRQELEQAHLRGIIDRAGMFRRLRAQSVLQVRQTTLLFQIQQLEDKEAEQQEAITECQRIIVRLEKKRHRLERFLGRIRHQKQQQRDMLSENEMQELTGRGQPNFS